MKKLFYMITTVAIAASFASCNKIEQDNSTTPVEAPAVDGTTTLTISATSPQTKTYLVDNGDKKNTNWTKDDLVTLFGLEDKTVTATAKNTTGSAAATLDFVFSGWPAAITPGYLVFDGPLAEQTEGNSVVSPVYNEEGTITATVRSLQVITNKSNMSKYANLSIGKVEENAGAYNTVMKNVCGLIKFELKGDETSVEDVLIKDALGNPMTGLVKVNYNGGQPEVEEVVERADYVQVKSNISGYNNKMLAGVYYACVLPGTYSPEITINHTDGTVTTLKMPENKTVTIERSQIFDFTTIYDPTPETGEGEGEGGEPEGDPIVLTVAMSYPFTKNLPTSLTKTKDTYYLKEYPEATYPDYKFVLYNPTDGYRLTSGTLRISSTANIPGYIQLPAIPGYTLKSIEITSGSTADKNYYVYANDPIAADGTLVATGNPALVSFSLKAEATQTVEVTGASKGVGYFLEAHSKNAQFTKLVLTYR